ncbi:MAG: Trk system potassium transporter TrkA, partial [Caulobacterales bacterium]|nr:Trk system potassium transporter TrkA [Caulobacterales bacterium]
FPHLKATVVGVRREARLFVPRDNDQMIVGDDVYIAVDAAHAERVLDIFGRQEDRARRVVIVGGGNVGVFLAQELEGSRGLRVRVIEAHKAHAERAAEQLKRTVVLHGDGLDPAILREAGAGDAEVVACLTNDDEVNVLAAALAKSEGTRRAVCLVNDRRYQSLKAALGIDVYVDPRATTVSTILQHVRKGRITGLQSIEDGEAEIVEGVTLDTSPLVGKPLKKADLGDGIAIGAVVRGDMVHRGEEDFVVQTGDRLVLFAERAHVGRVEKMFRVALEYF